MGFLLNPAYLRLTFSKPLSLLPKYPLLRFAKHRRCFISSDEERKAENLRRVILFAKKRDILIVQDVSIPQPEVIQSQPGFCFVRKEIHITSKFYLQNKYSLTATHQAKNTSNEHFRTASHFRGS
jgi:hypothetical protein